MLDSETKELIEEVLQGLWPNWKPKEVEYQVWAKKLQRYDFEQSKNIITEWFGRTERPGARPIPGIIISLLRKTTGGKEDGCVPDTLIFVKCIEHPERQNYEDWEIPIYVNVNQDDPDYIMRAAESTRLTCIENYGGKWITVQKAPFENDGLVGNAAKEQAEKNILAGPDTPGRRWLLERKEILKKVPPEIDLKAEVQRQKEKLLVDELPF
jgi:hypothetical protein